MRNREGGLARGLRVAGTLWLAVLFGLAPAPAAVTSARAADTDGEPIGKVAVLPAQPGPHWFWLSDVMLHRTALFDGDSGKQLGTITAGSVGVGFIVAPRTAPDHHEIYIAESYYSRGIRGDRTDVVTVYDAKTLMPSAEIEIPPKRAEYFPGVASSALSDDGRFLAVFNVTPAQSVSIVDVIDRRFAGEVQTPGCSLVYPEGPRRFFMLCANGEALVISLADDGTATSVERTAHFFDAEKDPIAEGGGRVGNTWYFVSRDGFLHSADLSGSEPKFGEPWSLLDDGDRKDGWRFGARQQLAVHAPSQRLYVLAHKGAADSHKQSGTEIWVYDLASKKRVQRIAVQNPLVSFIRGQSGMGRESLRERILWRLLERVLPNTGADAILVTQDPHPVLVAASMIPPAVLIYDAQTGEFTQEISEPGIATGLLAAP